MSLAGPEYPSYQKEMPSDWQDDSTAVSQSHCQERRRTIMLVGITLTTILVACVASLGNRRSALVPNVATAAMTTRPSLTDKMDSSREVTRKEKILEAIQDLQQSIEGTIYLPGDSHFDRAAHVWVESAVKVHENSAPWAVIEVANEVDVQKTVPVLAALKEQYNFHFRVRSGGHNKAGYSTVSEGAVISMVRLNHIELLEGEALPTGTAVARMGPAVLVQDFAEQVLAKHGYGGVIGFCGTVAEAGFVMGGGIGLQSRMHGLGADNAKGFRIVLADGSVHYASSDEDSTPLSRDLFFALRGAGGGSFGVVTEIDYYVHSSEDQFLGRGVVLEQPEAMATFLYRLGEKEPDLPGNLMVMNDVPGVANLMYSGRDPGEVSAGPDLMDSVINELHPEGVPRNITEVDIGWSTIYSTDIASSWGRGMWAAGCWYGFLMPENNTLEIWKDIKTHMSQGVQESAPYLLPDIEFWGGKIRETPWNETAFPHRNALFNVGVLLMVPVEEEEAEPIFQEHYARVNAWWPKIQQYLQGSFVNYPMTAMAEGNYAEVYWGDNLPRLVDIKQRVDPQHLFQFPMSVPMEL